MAITSIGYPKTIAAGDDYAIIQRLAGKRYAAAGHSDFQVTKAGTGTRQANIDDGFLIGKGVLVQNTAPTSLNLPAPAGTSQWHCVVLNRWVDNPDPDPEAVPYLSTLGSVAGTTARAIPALTTSDGGALDQDPIALCRVTNSSTLIQEVVDLRLISVEGAGLYIAHSDLAMFRLNSTIGAEVYRTDNQTFYKRIIDANGAASWKSLSQVDAVLTGFDAVEAAEENWGRNDACRMVRSGEQRFLTASVNRIGGSGSFTSNTRGGLTDQILATVADEDRPAVPVQLIGELKQGADTTHAVFGRLTTFGNIMLTSMLPGITVNPGDDIWMTGNYWTS